MDTFFVGIDVSKDRLDVFVRPEGKAFAVARDGKGLAELVKRLNALRPALIAMEATGGYETVVAAALAGAGLPLVVVNPAQMRHFAQALGKRAKTDPIDAQVIAHFAEATKPELRPLPDEATQMLGDLVARRRQIIEMIVAERQRERATNKRLRKSIARLIAMLEKEISSSMRYRRLVRGSPVWREKEDLLASVPGIGNQNGPHPAGRIARTGHARPQAHRKPGRACPFHPPIRRLERQKHDRRRARTFVRRSFLPPWSAPSQSAPQSLLPTPARRRKTQNGRAIAVASKLLTILNAVLRDKQPWQTA